MNFTNLSQAAKFVSIVHKLQMGGVHFQILCHSLESKHLDDANNSMLETWDKNIYPLEWSFTNFTHIESTTNDITDLRNIVWGLRLWRAEIYVTLRQKWPIERMFAHQPDTLLAILWDFKQILNLDQSGLAFWPITRQLNQDIKFKDFISYELSTWSVYVV